METNLFTLAADNFINKPIGFFKPNEQTSPATMILSFVGNGNREFRNVESFLGVRPNRRQTVGHCHHWAGRLSTRGSCDCLEPMR
jgi:hypothetical protein